MIASAISTLCSTVFKTNTHTHRENIILLCRFQARGLMWNKSYHHSIKTPAVDKKAWRVKPGLGRVLPVIIVKIHGTNFPPVERRFV